MPLFLATYVNKVDKKGRVSIPATFRAGLVSQGYNGVIAFPSINLPTIEGWGMERMEALSAGIDSFDPFSDEHDAFTLSILADARPLPFDTEGRGVLTEELIAHARITETAAFVGRGSTFQIWDPDSFRSVQVDARTRAKQGRQALKLRRESGP